MTWRDWEPLRYWRCMSDLRSIFGVPLTKVRAVRSVPTFGISWTMQSACVFSSPLHGTNWITSNEQQRKQQRQQQQQQQQQQWTTNTKQQTTNHNPHVKAPSKFPKASCEIAAEWVAALALLEEMLHLQLESSAPWRRSKAFCIPLANQHVYNLSITGTIICQTSNFDPPLQFPC